MLATDRPLEAERLEGRGRNHRYAGVARILMPAANPTTTEVDPALRRVPKLAVRNRLPDDDAVPDFASTTHLKSDGGSLAPSSTHSPERTMSPTLERRQSDQSYESIRLPSQRESRDGLPTLNKDQKASKKKRKTTGVFGFLTLKEPSTSAWEEFAQQQKKAAAQKGNKGSTVGMPGVSSQKLPEFVPKTNSKWDGVPDNAKWKVTESKARSQRMSTISTATRQSNWSIASSFSDGSAEHSPARKYGSLTSKVARPQTVALAPTKRGSVQSSTPSEEPGQSVHRSSAPNAVRPVLRDTTVTPWAEPVEEQAVETITSPPTFLHPPSPPPTLPNSLSLLPSPVWEVPDIPRLDDCDASSNAHTSPETSPQTPPFDDHPGTLPNIEEQYRYFVPTPEPAVATGDGAATFWHSDTDTDDAAAKPDTSLPKASVNFSRPRAKHTAASIHGDHIPPTIEEGDEESDMLQPTLRDMTGRTAPFLFDFYDAAYASDMPGPTHTRQASTETSTSLSTSPAPGRMSTSSRFTSISANTATTAPAPLQSPTFSTVPSESTRPSTAASTATAARRSSLSPERSNSECSIAASVMSMQWTMSPKQRLGLGGRVVRREKVDVLPWEEERPSRSGTPTSRGDSASKGYSMASQGTSEAGKLKRLSIRLGRR